MFEVGDKVIVVTDDELNGLMGEITGLSQNQHAAYVTPEEDLVKYQYQYQGYDYSMFFFFTELRKVDQA